MCGWVCCNNPVEVYSALIFVFFNLFWKKNCFRNQPQVHQHQQSTFFIEQWSSASSSKVISSSFLSFSSFSSFLLFSSLMSFVKGHNYLQRQNLGETSEHVFIKLVDQEGLKNQYKTSLPDWERTCTGIQLPRKLIGQKTSSSRLSQIDGGRSLVAHHHPRLPAGRHLQVVVSNLLF